MTRFFVLSMTLLVILCSSINQAASEVYYIETNSHHCGTMHPCLTLSQFAANSSHSLHSNTTVTLIFFPGIHNLSYNLMVSNVKMFTTNFDNSSITTQIKCKNDPNIYFNQSQSIRITNLEFIGCPGTLEHVEEFVIKDSRFEGRSQIVLQLFEITAAQIINTTFGNITSEEGVLISVNSTVTIDDIMSVNNNNNNN